MPDALLQLSDVDASYGPVQALRGVSLTARNGSVTAIVGVNGAGKTTALNVIAGLVPATRGRLVFEGRECSTRRQSVIRPGVALSPEGRRLFPHMSAEENLLVGAFTERSQSVIAGRLAEVYDRFPRLAERRTQKAGTLSGGEQQMAAIGRALMAGPRLLLLDEPTLGLAPKMVSLVKTIIEDLRADGLAIVLVEQNANVAFSVADYAYVLDVGRLALEGAAADLRGSDLVREAYLSRSSAE